MRPSERRKRTCQRQVTQVEREQLVCRLDDLLAQKDAVLDLERVGLGLSRILLSIYSGHQADAALEAAQQALVRP